MPMVNTALSGPRYLGKVFPTSEDSVRYPFPRKPEVNLK
jgi:hypothetical protein